jgi:hypothetical protein
MKDERRGNTAGSAKNGVKPASTVSGGSPAHKQGMPTPDGKGKKGTSGSEILDYQTTRK